MDVSKSSYYIHPTCYTVPEQYQSCHPVRIFSFIFKSVLVDYVAGDSDCDSYLRNVVTVVAIVETVQMVAMIGGSVGCCGFDAGADSGDRFGH